MIMGLIFLHQLFLIVALSFFSSMFYVPFSLQGAAEASISTEVEKLFLPFGASQEHLVVA